VNTADLMHAHQTFKTN